MPSLSPKENYLRCLRHEEYEYVPLDPFTIGGDAGIAGPFPPDHGDASTGFVDGFGVRWVTSPFAPGGLIPEPGQFILSDVTRWKKDITIPDVEDYDWEKIADDGMGSFPFDHDQKAFAEVERCFRDYGGKKGYIFSGSLLLPEGAKDAEAKNAAIIETASRLRYETKIA
jgi:hypothetical protein